MISYNTKASAYCGGLILKQTDMKTTMLWCSAHQPTQEQINELEEKGRLILLKEHLMMERISNCPNNRQEIKELISDFRDVLESFDACTIVQLGGSPLFLFMAGSFIQGAMNKGIYYSLIARE
jgi:hypothetical protein